MHTKGKMILSGVTNRVRFLAVQLLRERDSMRRIEPEEKKLCTRGAF